MREIGRSERRACELANLSRSTYRYQPTPRSDEPMRARLKELARRHLSYGTPRLTALLRREFGPVNHKRVERIYREEALQLPRRKKTRRRGPAPRQPLAAPTRPRERWSMDFMSDGLADGRRSGAPSRVRLAWSRDDTPSRLMQMDTNPNDWILGSFNMPIAERRAPARASSTAGGMRSVSSSVRWRARRDVPANGAASCGAWGERHAFRPCQRHGAALRSR
jgi:hypothetical protein